MIRCERVSLRYSLKDGPDVLRELSFEVPEGGFRWLLGPSGAGKTSLLRLLYLAARPTSGRPSVLGTDIGSASRSKLALLRRRIGVVFQDFRLLPHLSAFDNVALPLRISGRPEGQIRADVNEMLRWVGLYALRHVTPPALSGGEQQRVAIARALATDPAFVIADEPTGNLDAKNGENVLKLIADLRASTGKTFIIATHDPVVASHADRAIRIVDGRIAELDHSRGVITQ